MSREIDERVVEMRFDNEQFEENANESIDTLKRLDDSLDFENSGQSLGVIQNAISKLNFDSFTSAMDDVGSGFNALETIAQGAFLRIGYQIESTAERMVRALSIDNISAGWTKFGEKTASVKTLVAQGYELSEVNEQMKRLNWFTDETSYNFTDMVSNIAKFTATGQKLDDSVTAMEGIALWAALSGQNATTASRAMYQLSQAMSKGALRMDDFRSIQNASMDNKEFREKALETAEAVGTIKKNADGTYKALTKAAASLKKNNFQFNEMFSSDALTRTDWFSDKVMMGMFDKYSAAVSQIYEAVERGEYDTASEAIEDMGDLVDAFGLKALLAGQEARTFTDVIGSVKDAVSTGWMNTFEMIFGDADEATKLWTDLSNTLYDVFAEPLNKQNEALELWKKKGGREDLIEGFKNIWEAFGRYVEPISSAWETIFPSETSTGFLSMSRTLLQLTEGFNDATDRLKEFIAPFSYFEESSGVDKDYLRLFSGITKESEAAAKAAGLLDENVGGVDKAFLRLYSDVDPEVDYVPSEAAIRRAENLNRIFEGLFSVVAIVKEAFEAVWDEAGKLFDKFMEIAGIPVFDSLLEILGDVGDYFTNLHDNLESNATIVKFFGKVGTILQLVLEKIVDVLKILLSSIDEIWKKLKKSEGFKKLADAFDRLKESLGELVFNILDGFIDALSKIKIGDDEVNIVDLIANALSFLASVLADLFNIISAHTGDISNFIGEFSGGIFGTIGQLFEVLGVTIGNFFSAINEGSNNLSYEGIDNFFHVAKEVLSTGIFASIVELIHNTAYGMEGITWQLERMGISVNKFLRSFAHEKNAEAILKIAEAIALLAASMFLLGLLKPEMLTAATSAMLILMGAIAGILVLYSKMNSVKITPGKSTFGTLVNEIANLGKQFAEVIKMQMVVKAIGRFLLMFAGAIAILAFAVKIIADLDYNAAQHGVQQVIVLMVALLGLTYAFNRFTDKKNNNLSIRMGISLIAISAAVAILTSCAKTICELTKEYSYDTVQTAVGNVILMVIALFGMATIYGRYAKKGVKLTAAISLAVIVLAVKQLVKTVQDLVVSTAEIDINRVWACFAMVVLLIGALAAIGVAISSKKVPFDMGAIMALGAFAKGVAKSMAMIFPFIIQLAEQDWSVIIKAVAVLGAIGLFIAGLSVLVGFIDGDFGSLVGAVGLLMLVSAVISLAKVLPELGQNCDAAAKGIGIMAGALLLLIGAAVLAQFVKGGLLAISLAAISIGVTMALVSVAVLSFAKAFEIVSRTIPVFVDSLIYVGQQIQAHGWDLAVTITAVLLAIFAAIVMAKSGLIGAVMTFAEGIAEGLALAMPSLLNKTWLMILILVAWITANIPGLVAMAINLVYRFFYNLIAAIDAAWPRLSNLFMNLIRVLWNILIDALASFLDTVGLGDVVRDKFRQDLLPAIDDMAVEGGNLLTEKYGDTVNNSDPNIDSDVLTNATKDAEEKQKKNANDQGLLYMEEYAAGQEEGMPIVASTTTDTMGVINAIFNGDLSKFKEGGYTWADVTASGFEEGSVREMFPEIASALDTVSNSIDTEDRKGRWKTAGFNLGGYLGEGAAEGITSKKDSVGYAMEDLVDHAIKSGNAKGMIKSPSRRTMWTGNMLSQGLIIGMLDKAGEVKKSASELASKALGTIDNAAKGIYDVLNSDLDLSPVIRPVLDDSEIQNGIGGVNDSFNKLAFAASGSYSGTLSSIKTANSQDGLNDTINKAVKNALNDITDKINSDTKTTIEVPLNIDGRRVAKATAQYTRGELARLDKYNSRKGGKV